MTFSPVFIVGSPRSGTSILTAALLRAGYNGFYEGNYLSLIRVIERVTDRHFQVFRAPNPKVLTSQIDTDALKAALADVVIDAATRLHPQDPWLDKTGGPEMIEAIPVLRARFPHSRYVFAKRRAIENLVSRIIKFPHLSFEYHCGDWARTMAAWRALKDTSPGADLIEVDQREIAAQPARVSARLVAFLDMPADAAAQMEHAFTRQRPQETEAGSSARVLSLETVGWSAEQREVFARLCGPEMALEGYSVDQGYWLQNSGETRP